MRFIQFTALDGQPILVKLKRIEWIRQYTGFTEITLKKRAPSYVQVKETVEEIKKTLGAIGDRLS